MARQEEGELIPAVSGAILAMMDDSSDEEEDIMYQYHPLLASLADMMRYCVRYEVGGIMRRRSSCGARLGLFGIFCVFSSTIMLATANYDDGFLDTFNRGNDPTVTTGSMLLFVGRKYCV
ncbi:hypothetical protein GWK47_042963 [Chionoecetes opilio]|uniref:Uncharacterized protein n=1 Tax=Chionoecetes opilio TaxID=41210 RepID=A0A8J4Y9V4_CHIOP|nr:hypothetical protein GWK47_042963 [Chionoecetes opilio]